MNKLSAVLVLGRKPNWTLLNLSLMCKMILLFNIALNILAIPFKREKPL